MNSLFIYKNNNYFFVVLLFALCVFTANSLAVNSVCGQDLNSSEFLEKNEIANCIKVENQDFCTIGSQDCNAKDVCPLGQQYSCQSGSCQKPSPSSCAAVVEVVKGTIEEAPYCSSDEGVWEDITNTTGSGNKSYWFTSFTSSSPTGAWAYLQGTKVYSTRHRESRYFQHSGVEYKRGAYLFKKRHYYYKLLKRIPGNYTCSSTQKTHKTLAACRISCDGLMQSEQTKVSTYSCPYTIDKYDNIKACQSSCFKKQACSKTYSCPTAGNSCVSYEGRQQCSPNSCVDLDENQAIKTDIANAIAIDDGQRDVNGACTDNILLFAGRNSSCRTAGLKTLYKTCCEDTDEVIKDTTNGLSVVDTASAIKGVYDAASVAYAAYQAGKTAAEVMTAAQNSLMGFDPTTIAISLAVSYILKELSCDQQDAETSVLKSSGYCHYVGEYCDTSWGLIGCVQKANAYCCFNSKIGRIIQEQARKQTGKSWGSPTSPKCTGLTPEEFQSLDFSDIDLSEYYGDIQAKSLAIVEENIGAGVENYYRQIR